MFLLNVRSSSRRSGLTCVFQRYNSKIPPKIKTDTTKQKDNDSIDANSTKSTNFVSTAAAKETSLGAERDTSPISFKHFQIKKSIVPFAKLFGHIQRHRLREAKKYIYNQKAFKPIPFLEDFNEALGIQINERHFRNLNVEQLVQYLESNIQFLDEYATELMIRSPGEFKNPYKPPNIPYDARYNILNKEWSDGRPLYSYKRTEGDRGRLRIFNLKNFYRSKGK